jgi:4-hydroxy-L-threonine phosphate dehydrogenase PdxA
MRAAVGIVSERLGVRPIGTVDEAVGALGWIEVLTPPGGEVPGHTWGETSVEGARAALACLAAAASLPVDAIVSAPLCKESLGRAGMRHPDELAMLAELTGSGEPVLVGVLAALWTTCVTSHVPLRAVPELITTPEVLASIRRLAGALTATQPAPRIAVAGLNPHAGESGSLGREELDQIAPAIERARADGLDVIGPLPPDTTFPRAIAEGFDGVVCMYHDQANIARKLHDMAGQATLFLGLPVPVTTTAHGTAFDRAGKGTARPDSLRCALEVALGQARVGWTA